MNLNDVLAPGTAHVRRWRVGRGPGSGHGKTAGRGQHGAYSRSGNSIKLGFEGGTMRFFRRLPRRGFSNAEFRVEWAPMNLIRLDAAFKAGETVTLALAIERGIIDRRSERMKVLSDGEITKALTFDAAVAVSAAARAKIEKAGGTVLMPLAKKQAPNWKRIEAEKAKNAKAKAAAEKPEKSDKAEKVVKAEKAPKRDKGDDDAKVARPKGEKKTGGDKPPKSGGEGGKSKKK